MSRKQDTRITIDIKNSLTKTKYKGEISPIEILNAASSLIRDFEEMSGMNKRIGLQLILDSFEENCTIVKKNPTMRASDSEKTAKED